MLYLVTGESKVDDEFVTYTYGIFSTYEKAYEVQQYVLEAMKNEDVKITELTLDVATEDFELTMSFMENKE